MKNLIMLSSLCLLLVLSFLLITHINKAPVCANSLSCKESLSLEVDNSSVGIFEGHEVTPPKIDLSEVLKETNVLGDETAVGEKHIYVDLTTQTLTAYQGDTLFMTAAISSGKWFPTPTGEFTIWEKIVSTKMSGGQGADYYYLPNVPYVMFFSNNEVAAGRGFSLHGAYWHNNFGHPMSHGCVNMRAVDAQKLYGWANPETVGNYTLATKENVGTKITIYGEAPL